MKPLKGGKHPEKSTDEMLKEMASMMKATAAQIEQNKTGISYSGLLLELIKPYQKNLKSYYELDYLLGTGMIAWNLALYKQKSPMLYKDSLSSIMSDPDVDKDTEKLIGTLVKDKEKHFGKHDVLLEDYIITPDKSGKTVVNVISKPFEMAMMEALSRDNFEDLSEDEDVQIDDEEDEDDDLPDYVAPFINRNAVVLKAKGPVFDWLRKIHFPNEPKVEKDEDSLYLLEEMETEKDVQKWLKNNFDRIFCNELWAWDMDENNWPKNRTYKMFTAWFEIKTHCMVYDLASHPLNQQKH